MANKNSSEGPDSAVSSPASNSNELNSFPCPDGSKSEDLLKGQSYGSGNGSDTTLSLTLNVLNNGNMLAKLLGSFKDLKGQRMCDWNKRAHVVYKAFNVKRFKVDEEHILCPVGGRTVDEVLRLCDDPQVKIGVRASWLQFLPKMNRILEVFEGDAHLILDGLTKSIDFDVAKKSLVNHIDYLAENPPDPALGPVFRAEELMLHHRIKIMLNEVRSNDKQPCGKFFEVYFEKLVGMFRDLSGVDIECCKGCLSNRYEHAMPSFGPVPEPDYFLSDRGCGILAVVEVENARKRCHSSHKCQHPKSYKDCQELYGTIDKDLEKALQEMDVSKEDEQLDDTFDQQECLLEERVKGTLPDHITHLDVREKKEIRSYMPRLFGQMLACTAIRDRCIEGLQMTHITQITGIGVVGFHVQFVMLVLKDVKEEIIYPTVADMNETLSVRPYLYVTRRLNLFKQSDLAIFFRTLFALGSHGNL